MFNASICTIRKLNYLSRIMAKEDEVSHCALFSLVDDVKSQCLVREYRELEQPYEEDYTSTILLWNQRINQGNDRSYIKKQDLAPKCSLPQNWNT